MATIERRVHVDKKNGKDIVRFRVKIRLKGFLPEEMTFERKTDAQEWAKKREYQLKHEQAFGSQAYKNKSVGEAIDRYLGDLLLTNPRRHDEILPIAVFWKDRCGPIFLQSLSKDKIAEERERIKGLHVKGNATLGRTLSNAHVNRMVSVLKRVLNVVVQDWGWLNTNPLNGLKSLPEPKGRTRFLQGDELSRLLDACRKSDNPQLLTFVVVAISTGARRGEIGNIRVNDIDFSAKQILFPKTKNGKPRVAHISGYALHLLRTMANALPSGQEYFFGSKIDQSRPNDFRTAWRTARSRANLQDFKFHDLRHSAASFLAMSGAGLHQIAEILGHSSLHVTKRYTHLLESQTAEIAGRMAEKVFADEQAPLAD